MRQMQTWIWNNTIDNSIASYVGYVQVTDTSYVDEAIMDNTIELNSIDTSLLNSINGVRGVFPRIQSFTLASYNIQAKVVGVLGYNPSTDTEELKLDAKLKSGQLLNDSDKSILITSVMADYFRLDIGDTVVLFGSGYQGMTAAGLYPIKGIVNIPAGNLSNMIFMGMNECQHFYAAKGRVSSVLVNIEDGEDMHEVDRVVKSMISNKSLIVRNWEEVLPGMKEGMDIDIASNKVMLSVLLVIVCFGIFGTIVMMYNERIMEFSILLSIGMGKTRILIMTLAEVYLLSILGILASWIALTPILYYINIHPIPLGDSVQEALKEYGMDAVLSVGLYPEIYLESSGLIFGMTMFMSLYVVVKILNLTPLSGTRKQ